MIRTLIITLVLLVSSSVAFAASVTSFDEGTQLDYTFDGTNAERATITLPRNACLQDISMVLEPSVIEETAIVPVDAVLITDVSGSMGWDWFGEPKIDLAKEVDTVFVDTFIDPDSELNQLSLVSYSSASELDESLTRDADALKSTIDAYTDGGSTCISCAIEEAINELQSGRTGDDVVKTIILMTDGQANVCTYGSSCSDDEAKQEAYDLACVGPDSAVGRGYEVNTVAFGDDADSILEDIANCPGNAGTFNDGDSPEALYDIYTDLARVVSSSYPTPEINLSDLEFYSVPDPLENIISIDPNCGDCFDPIDDLNDYLYECAVDSVPCSIIVDAGSVTAGYLTISDLEVTYEPAIGALGTGPGEGGIACEFTPICGNGIQEFGEECDSEPYCSDECTYSGPSVGAVCGDAIHDNGEACDDGEGNLDPSFDCALGPGERCSFCTTSCEVQVQSNPGDAEAYACGNGWLEPGIGETCDRGDANGNACTPGTEGCTYCSSSCEKITLPGVDDGFCGDGPPLDAGEQCDRGTENVPPGTTCTPQPGGSCTLCYDDSDPALACQLYTNTDDPEDPAGGCGDGFPDPGEQCDYGDVPGPDGDVNRPAGYDCGLAPGETCEWCEQVTCELHVDTEPPLICGNGITQPLNGEVCDDGNPNEDDLCANDCTLTYCGDGIQQTPNGAGAGGPLSDGVEECDGSDGVIAGYACSSSCKLIDNTPPEVPSSCPTFSRVTSGYFAPIDLKLYVEDAVTDDADLVWDVSTVSGLDLETGLVPAGWYDLENPIASNGYYEPTVTVWDEAGNDAMFNLCITAAPSVPVPPTDPETELLVSKSVETSGSVDKPSGSVDAWGPYRIEVRVWRR